MLPWRVVTFRGAAYALYLLVCLLAITGPGYAWLGNRIEPRILGLPFTLVWNMLWVLLSFFALAAFHFTAPRSERDAPGAKR